MSYDEDEIMRRRRFILDVLQAAGLAIAPGVIDSAARLELHEASGSMAHQVAELEQTAHLRALEWPTVPAVDQLPRLLHDFTGAWHLAVQAKGKRHARVHGSMAYLAGLLASNLTEQAAYERARAWYRRGYLHAELAGDREAQGWLAARWTAIAWYLGDNRQVLADAAFAQMRSPLGQLGSMLAPALAASAAARMGPRYRVVAQQALDDARRGADYRGEETFTAYSFPSYQFGRFESEVFTRLGDTRRAYALQDQALAGFPAGAVASPAFIRLDQADCLRQDGDPKEAARHATQAVLALPPERALPIILDRGNALATAIGAAGGDDTDHLRHVLRQVRSGSG
ncbi:MAG: hypothetical protein ACRDRZ_03945 [Pseudonocardiaceae bacterium]